MDSISEISVTTSAGIRMEISNEDDSVVMADHGTFGPQVSTAGNDVDEEEGMDEDDNRQGVQVITTNPIISSGGKTAPLLRNEPHNVTFSGFHQEAPLSYRYQNDPRGVSAAFVSNGNSILSVSTTSSAAVSPGSIGSSNSSCCSGTSSINNSSGSNYSILKSSSADVVSTVNSAIMAKMSANLPIQHHQQYPFPKVSAAAPPPTQFLVSAVAGNFSQSPAIVSQPSSCGKLFSQMSTDGNTSLNSSGSGGATGGYTLLRSASGPSGKSCASGAYVAATAEKTYSANASSEVKSTLQRHILSKRFSANAAFTIGQQQQQHHGKLTSSSNSFASSSNKSSSSFLLSPPGGTTNQYLQPPSSFTTGHLRMLSAGGGGGGGGAGLPPTSPSSGVLLNDSLDHMLYATKRSLTLSNSYGATATQPNVSVKPEPYKEPLRKTYSEPNLKMVRNKLKLQPPHDEALMENEQMQHGATQSGNSLVSRQIHLSAAHHHPLHPANRQHRAIASCKSTPHEVMFSPGAGNNNGSNSSSSGVGIGISPMFGSLHSATKRSSVDYLLPAPPSHKSKTMPLFPLQPASAQQEFGARKSSAAAVGSSGAMGIGGDGVSSGNHLSVLRQQTHSHPDNPNHTFHSPLRVRLSDENSSCGSVSPQVMDGNSMGSNYAADAVRKQAYHSFGPFGSTGSSGVPGGQAPTFPHQGISKSSSYHGSILDFKGVHGQQHRGASLLPPHSPPDQQSTHLHSVANTSANAAAISAILSAAAVQNNSQIPTGLIPSLQQLIEQQRQLLNQPPFFPSPHTHVPMEVASSQNLSSQNAPTDNASKLNTMHPSPSEILERIRMDPSLAADPAIATILMQHLNQHHLSSAVAMSSNQIPLYRHLSESALQQHHQQSEHSSTESNSHPPLRRILGPNTTPANVSGVPPMPALLSFASSDANSGVSPNISSGQQQASTSPIIQSLSADSAILKDQILNCHNQQQQINSSILSAAAAANHAEEYAQLFNYYYRQYTQGGFLGVASSPSSSLAGGATGGDGSNSSTSHVAPKTLLVPALTPPKVVLEPPPPTPEFADMQLTNTRESNPHADHLRSSWTKLGGVSHSKASGPGMQALQAKLEKKKKREALSAVMKEEASSPVMDLSCVSGSANTDTESGGGDQLHPMDDTDSAVDSTSNSALQKSLPDNGTNIGSANWSSTGQRLDAALSLASGSNVFDVHKKQPGVVLKKHQIFMMHSLQNSAIGATNEEKKLSNVETYSAQLASKRTGLGYNPVVLKHLCVCGNENDVHAETPLRVQYVWIKLLELDIPKHCKVSLGREVQTKELESVHNAKYVKAFSGRDQYLAEELSSQLAALSCGGKGVDMDLVWNSQTSPEACLGACGVVLELAEKVAKGELSNAFALIRPPGHLAENSQPLGFSFFNNVAIAAKTLLSKNLARKIAIIDWDIHHGVGTQRVFESDPNVLFLSVHRFDHGSFFPGTGNPASVGTCEAPGATVNVGFSSHEDVPMADEDYMAAFRAVVLPFCQHFNPDMVIVSAGFDAARGHAGKLGGYIISPECFGWMTKQVLNLAGGKVLLCLEDGFDLKSLTDSIVSCMYQLIRAPSEHEASVVPGGGATSPLSGDHHLQPSASSSFMQRLMHPPLVKKTSLDALPSPEAIQSIEATLAAHEAFWPPELVKFARNQLHISQSQADSLSQSQSANAAATVTAPTITTNADTSAAANKVDTTTTTFSTVAVKQDRYGSCLSSGEEKRKNQASFIGEADYNSSRNSSEQSTPSSAAMPMEQS